VLIEHRYGIEHRQPSAHGTFGIIIVSFRPPEIRHHTIAEILGDVPAKTLNRLSCGAMVIGDYLAPFLGVETRSEGGRAHQITE
jgi:hypothetical protein